MDTPAEIQQRRRQVRGLLLIAAVVLIGSVWRAGLPKTMKEAA